LRFEEKINDVNLSNAKLFYTNEALNSDSLNERQKDKIVEAVFKADSVEEAKIIYETLQSTVGSISKGNAPKSLNEVISRRSSAFLPRKEEKQSDSVSERLQILAGIKNK
jgi:hypothetical protein